MSRHRHTQTAPDIDETPAIPPFIVPPPERIATEWETQFFDGFARALGPGYLRPEMLTASGGEAYIRALAIALEDSAHHAAGGQGATREGFIKLIRNYITSHKEA